MKSFRNKQKIWQLVSSIAVNQIGFDFNPSQILSYFPCWLLRPPPLLLQMRKLLFELAISLQREVYFMTNVPPGGWVLLIFACCCAASSEWSWALRAEHELSDWVLLLSAARPCAASCLALNLQLSRRGNHYYFTHCSISKMPGTFGTYVLLYAAEITEEL